MHVAVPHARAVLFEIDVIAQPLDSYWRASTCMSQRHIPDLLDDGFRKKGPYHDLLRSWLKLAERNLARNTIFAILQAVESLESVLSATVVIDL